jgi:hypothetical protein
MRSILPSDSYGDRNHLETRHNNTHAPDRRELIGYDTEVASCG